MIVFETLLQPLFFAVLLCLGFFCGFIFNVATLLKTKWSFCTPLFDFCAIVFCGYVLFCTNNAFNYGIIRLYVFVVFVFALFLQRVIVGKKLDFVLQRWYTNKKAKESKKIESGKQ